MKNHTVTIRMGAPEWSVTVQHQGQPLKFDMRKLDKAAQRQVIFRTVEAFRIMRDARDRVAA